MPPLFDDIAGSIVHFDKTGPMIRYDGETLHLSDLNPECHMHWRMSRGELLGIAARCMAAALDWRTRPALATRRKRMEEQMTGHAIVRTSPKGTPFVGTCTKCGLTGLTPRNMHDECPNVRGVSEDDALMEVLDPKGHAQ